MTTMRFPLLVLLATAWSPVAGGKKYEPSPLNDPKVLFDEWTTLHKKKYESRAELSRRSEIWLDNHFIIEEHNNQVPPPSFRLGHNQFSDLTFDEFKKMNRLGEYSPGYLGTKGSKPSKETASQRRLKDLPESVDWVKEGAVTEVKNQGMCGSCWAFSAIGAIESARYLDTGELVSLSEQQLVDCDPLDHGCSGGLMDNAFLFDENSTGICSEADYPYVGRWTWFRGCLIKKDLCEPVSHTIVSSFVDVNKTNADLLEAITLQPVSVAIEADQTVFQFYKSGIFDAPCGANVDHGVLAVGYGTEHGKDYWLVKNSWAATWGDEGYIKMARKSKNKKGTCGILSFPSRPELKG